MRTSTILRAALMASSSFAAATPDKANVTSSRPTFYNSTCTPKTVTIRKEWRTLCDEEKAAYIQSQECLMALPAQTSMKNVTSRFSDLQAAHRAYTDDPEDGDIIHWVGQFLPWHRLMLHALETVLKDECGYTGPLVWWDELLDAESGNFFGSSMWDPATGFGGNGTKADGGCLTNGPFANTTEHIGPQLEYSDYCLQRSWDNDLGLTNGNATVIDMCNAKDTYDEFWLCVALYPHHGAHSAVGGLMADKYTAAGDPTFYLHHSYVDRLWWQWQREDGEKRLNWMSGNTVNETLYPEKKGVNATLDYVLQFADIVPDVAIREVMNAQGGFLCYDYDY